MTSTAALPHIRSLTGLRALAAAWVVLLHTQRETLALFPVL